MNKYKTTDKKIVLKSRTNSSGQEVRYFNAYTKIEKKGVAKWHKDSTIGFKSEDDALLWLHDKQN